MHSQHIGIRAAYIYAKNATPQTAKRGFNSVGSQFTQGSSE